MPADAGMPSQATWGLTRVSEGAGPLGGTEEMGALMATKPERSSHPGKASSLMEVLTKLWTGYSVLAAKKWLISACTHDPSAELIFFPYFLAN